jgi:parallel beta-helix repeat protein
MRRVKQLLVGFVLIMAVASCGSSSDDAAESSGDETASTAETAETTTAAPTTTTEAPTTTAVPVTAENLQELLLDAQSGDVIEIPAGTYSFDRGLSLNVDGVTIRGVGMDETILSFAEQVAGAEGLLVSASDFTIEDIAIEDTVGDALKINEGDNITIRRVRTEWTGGYATDNGAYGLYPVQTTNVLIEDSVAIGASDAGIYVGQSNNIVVRNNFAEFNVAGIEIENSIDADVYGNVTTNNTGGILVFNLPGLSQEGFRTRVYDNDVYENNTENFSPEGTTVSVVPAGSGILILANDQVEIFGNRISDNRSSNIIVASGPTVNITGDNFDGFPEGVYIHDNEMSGGGDEPDGILRVLGSLLDPTAPIPGVVWDGGLDEAKLVDGEPLPENRICVQQPGVEVLNADGVNGFAAPRIDTEAVDCALEPLEPVVLDTAA